MTERNLTKAFSDKAHGHREQHSCARVRLLLRHDATPKDRSWRQPAG
jgi:hypothetical protein